MSGASNGGTSGETPEERAARIKERRDEAIKHVSMTPGMVKTLRKAQRARL